MSIERVKQMKEFWLVILLIIGVILLILLIIYFVILRPLFPAESLNDKIESMQENQFCQEAQVENELDKILLF